MRRLPLTIFSAAVGILCIVYYVLCGCLYSFSLSGLWIWPAFGLILIFGCAWKFLAEPKIPDKGAKLYRRLKGVCLTVFSLFLLGFAVFEGFVVAEWINGCRTGNVKPDAVIVLGAAVEYDRPGDALAGRINTACDYIEKYPGTTVVACGGLGDDDIITEAECIKRELARLGIPEDTVITEDRSCNTAENFRYAAPLLPEDAETVAVVTNGFHQFRALKIGKTAFADSGLQVKLIPVSAEYKGILLPYRMVREFAAFVSNYANGYIGR